MKNIALAFVRAKGQFGPALKDKTNPAFRSKYADLGACIDAVEDALLANDIAFIQETSEDPTGVTVETVFLHTTGEMIRCGKLHVPAAKQDPQGYGSALTYARRYSLMAACGIAPEDDDGNAAVKSAKAAPKARTGVMADVLEHIQLSPEVYEYLRELADKVKNDVTANISFDVIHSRLEAEQLDNEQKIYLASLLPSNINNPLKAVSLAKRAAS